MNVNFNYISEIAFLVFVLGHVVVIDNVAVDETNYNAFISGTVDA